MITRCWCGGDVDEHHVEGQDEPVRLACRESAFHDPASDGRPKQVKRIYVAGPMSGYPESNYPAFNAAENLLVAEGFEVVNPAKIHVDAAHYVDLIREDLYQMLNCHAVATLDRWWESVGARNEVQVAGILRMPVQSVEEWVRFSIYSRHSSSPASSPKMG